MAEEHAAVRGEQISRMVSGWFVMRPEAPGDIATISRGLGSPREQYPRLFGLASGLGGTWSGKPELAGGEVGLRPQKTGAINRLWGRVSLKLETQARTVFGEASFPGPRRVGSILKRNATGGVLSAASTGPLRFPLAGVSQVKKEFQGGYGMPVTKGTVSGKEKRLVQCARKRPSIPKAESHDEWFSLVGNLTQVGRWKSGKTG